MPDWLDLKLLFAAALVGYLGLTSIRSRRRSYAARQWGALGARAFVALVALAGGFAMAAAVDDGMTHAWAWPRRAAWVSAMLALTVFGIWTLIRGVFGGEENPRILTLWKPLAACLGIGALSFALIALDQLRIAPFNQSALFVGGTALAGCAWLKPAWFWNHPKAMFLRELLGDHATAAVYLVGGLVMVGFACFGHFAGLSH
jgi:hypothetical protein